MNKRNIQMNLKVKGCSLKEHKEHLKRAGFPYNVDSVQLGGVDMPIIDDLDAMPTDSARRMF